MSIEIFGIYEKTLFRDDLSAATYFSLRVPEEIKERNKFGCITIAAHIPRYIKGTPMYIEGKWVKTEKGYLFKADLVREEAWHEAFTASYLASICKGISYKTGTKIAKKYGRDTFSHLCSDSPEEIAKEIWGFSAKKAEKLSNEIKKTAIQRELFDFILKYGGFYPTAVKLSNEYGASAKTILQNNPFEIGLKFGLTFEQCDRIARDAGGHAASAKRLYAAANSCMSKNALRGNTYITHSSLIQNMKNMLEKAAYPDELPYVVLSGSVYKNEKLFVEEDFVDRVFLKSLRFAEMNVAVQINRLISSSVDLDFKNNLIEKVQRKCHIEYAPQQKEAFACLKKTGVAIITGGPGTGKTTTINGIISAFEMMYPDKKIRLCAPTGRAAQRMMESTGKEAVTIHRLLEYRPFGNNGEVTHKTADDPIEADFIVVDEASMLDVDLANIFLSAVKSESLVLFVGDTNQLPSVGPGDVLHDMILSNVVPVFKLSTVYRQANNSPIITNANNINDGIDEFVENDEFRIIYEENSEQIKEDILRIMSKIYNKNNPFETQVLVPTHKGDAGVNALNNALQELLNPHQENKCEKKYGSKTFRVNDKILMLNNNYVDGYYNGDLGTVESITNEGMYVCLLDKRIFLTHEMMEDVTLAYAMSIHKSQGSEFKNVVIALPYQPTAMLKRNLLYTAITRAKNNVTIISEYGAVAKSIATPETGKRKTWLAERLNEQQQFNNTTMISTTKMVV